MGLNYVVTLGNPNGPLNSSVNNSIKVIDYDFMAFDKNNWLYHYSDNRYDLSSIAFSVGNDQVFFAYEAGGGNYASISSIDDKFGFGKENGQSSTYSIWLKNRTNTIGETNHIDQIGSQSFRVFYAGVAEHSEGYILRGKFPPLHQYKSRSGQKYKLSIISRINPISGANPNDTVAIVYFGNSATNSESEMHQIRPKIDLYPYSMDPEQLTLPFVIRANQFNSNGEYTNLIIPFEKLGDNNDKLTVDILW